MGYNRQQIIMRKKLFTLLLAIVASIGLTHAEIYSGTCGTNLTWSLNTEDSTLVIEGSGVIDTGGSQCYDCAPWSYYKRYIAHVSLPEGLTSISHEAFMNCIYLKSITIPSTVRTIGNSAFSGCIGLQSVVLPNGIYKIEYAAFQNCTALTSLVVPSSIYEYNIDERAFDNVPNLIYTRSGSYYSNDYPWGAKCVNGYVDGNYVYGNESKTYLGACTGNIGNEVVIPSTVTAVNSEAFTGCLQISSIIWNVKRYNTDPKSADYSPLYNIRSKINSIVFGDSVQIIPSYLCYGMSKLSSVIIPENVTYIGNYAFSNMSTSSTITCLSSEPASIGYSPFSAGSIYVPCGAMETYKSEWSYFTSKIKYNPSKYTINTDITPEYSGTVKIPENICENQITAVPTYGYHFVKWSDGVTDNPRIIGLTQDTSFTAEFAMDIEGVCGDDYTLNWAYDTIAKKLTIEGNGGLTTNIKFGSIPHYLIDTLIIGEGITTIGEAAFYAITKLKVVIWNAKHCTDFTSNSTPFYYYKSKNYYLNYDWRLNISSLTFGDEVEYIPTYLCAGMKKAEIIIKNCKTEIGAHALDDCNYTVEGAYNIILPDTTLCYGEELIIDGVQCDNQKTPNIRQTCTLSLTTVEGCDSTISISALWKRVAPLYDFNFTVKDAYDTPNTGSISWTVSGNTDYKYDYYTINGKKYGSTTGLKSGEYRLVFYCEECNDSIVKNITIDQYGLRINGMYYLLDDLYHTATLTYRGTSYGDYSGEYSGNITIPKTITFEGKDYQVTGIKSYAFEGCNNISSITMESGTPISMYSSGLSSNCVIYVPFGSLNAYKSASGWKNYTIHVINPSHATTTTAATSAKITLGNTDEAKHISSCGMEGGEEFAGNVIEYIGLEPNSEYANVPLFIKTKEGDLDNTTVSFTTTTLELTTKPSKPVSSSTALLFAETNMSDAEVSCGFEYKRNDAPADMEGNKVFCPVASGQMAGRLKNLKDDVYYKYRAFYQSAAGNMYYGDWQYIFTGDVAVEFDPILYTYGATVVRENEATISGYALAGSEDFTEQGFEYWAESRANNGANAPRRMPAALGEHFFVQASGISLRVTLNNLDAGTVYKYRVYGKVGDQYYYGSEQTFTTTGTYTPPTYTITFANWDGTELQSSQVEEGTLPEYTGATPERPENEQYTYSFNGWTPTIVIASADATYTATYTATPKSQGIEDVLSDQVQCTKVIRNGQIFIIRGDKTYTLQGQEVK